MSKKKRRSVALPDGRVAIDIGHAGRMAIFPAEPPVVQPPEHDFTGTADDWEARVFANAVKFRLHWFYGKGGRDEVECDTFPEAMTMAAMALDNPGRPNSRVLVYAVAASGRFIALPEKRWPEYLKKWKDAHDQAGTVADKKGASVGKEKG